MKLTQRITARISTGIVLLTTATLAGAGTVPAAASAGPGWSQVPAPSPQAPQAGLNAVSCHSPSACVTVGDYYNADGAEVTLAEAWRDGKWAVQPTPDPTGAGDSVLLAVSCVSSSACMAVGYARQANGGYPQHALTEVWNGKSWMIEPSPAPAHVSLVELMGVSCTSPSACVAVGEGAHGNHEVPLAESWDGHQWAIHQVPVPRGAQYEVLSGVSCTAATACTAVGQRETGDITAPLAEAWNGSAWAAQPTPNPSGGPSVLLSVSCLPASTTCTAVGYSRSNDQDVTLAEVRHGSTWKVQPTPTPTGTQGIVQGLLTGVSCGSATACSEVGDHIDKAGHQVKMAETWNGTAWKIVPAPAAGDVSSLAGVSCPDAGHCRAAGLDYNSYLNEPPGDADSFTLAGAWNGTSWTTEASPSPDGLIFNALPAISCASSAACATVGYYRSEGSSVALSEIWDGTRWAIQPVPAPAAADYSELTAVSCASATWCMAVGDYQSTTSPESIMSEIWNGSRWTLKTMPTPADSSTQAYGLSCISATFCVAVGSGGALTEIWNGTKWTIKTTPAPPDAEAVTLNAVSCASATSCSAVGSYYTGTSPVLSFAEYWNGSAWTLQSTVNASGSGTDTYLTGVSCPAQGVCTAVGSTDTTTLVETLKDSTWTVVSSPSPGTSPSLLGVSCASTTACSAVGEYGNASNYGIPLAEAWNGHAWTVQPVPVQDSGAFQVDYLYGVSCVTASWCLASGSNQAYYVPATGSLSGLTERYS